MAGYGTDLGFTDWLAENGYEVPSGALASAVLRQRGSTYIDSLYGLKFSGDPTDGYAQERAWPRTGATVHGADIPSTVVPDAVIKASYFAALQEATSPGSLSVVVTGSEQVKREKVGAIEVEYVAGSGSALMDATPMLSTVAGLLAPFFFKLYPSIFVV